MKEITSVVLNGTIVVECAWCGHQFEKEQSFFAMSATDTNFYGAKDFDCPSCEKGTSVPYQIVIKIVVGKSQRIF